VPIKAVVFDIGGVLETTPEVNVEASWETRLGLPSGAFIDRMRDVFRAGSIGTASLAEVKTALETRLSMTPAQVEDYMADLWAAYLGTLNTELEAYFRGLRPRFKTAILSNSFVGAREQEERAYGFGDLCDVHVYSHEVGMSKPDPRIYHLTCERLGVQPHEAVFLDDRAPAVDGAHAIGMHGVVFQNNQQAMADIEAIIAAQAT
jgi:putative hydrolase of the HAD superfamily